MDRTRCTLRLPQSLDKKIERAALSAGITRSEFLRRLISDSLNRGREDDASLRATVARLHNRLSTLQNSHDMLLSMLSLFVRRWYTHQRPILDRKERAVAEALGEKAHRAFLKQLLEGPDQLSDLIDTSAREDEAAAEPMGEPDRAVASEEGSHLDSPGFSPPSCETGSDVEAARRSGPAASEAVGAGRLRVPPRPNVPSLTQK